ncbi:MAG TPA: secretin and TonB N-terminal domain-containing protein, partial [Burkholderiales bacterium]|nr:secretin and TonB N-terminal domain-containing protein [Burkholderiales bacterium]
MKRLAIFLTLAMVAGCAGDTLRQSQALIENGNEEQGLERLERAVREHPNDVELRNYYLRHRAVAVQRYLQTGDNARAAGAIDAAEVAYRRAQRFEPDNANAQAGLEAVTRERASQVPVREAEEAFKRGAADEAYEKARQALAVNPGQRSARAIVRKVEEQRVKAEGVSPQLTAALKSTVTIELRDAPVRSVLELISKRSGLNFVYDRDVSPDLRVTVSVRDTTIEEVLRFVLVTSQLERRVLNSNTVLVYPNTPTKAQAYRELTVKSFYLANADVKATANMVRSLAKTRDLYVDEKLNLLIVRDTPEAVRMVEKLIAAQDLGEPEVMLEVEVLEVGQNTLSQIGIDWPNSASVSVIGGAGVPGQLTGTEAQNLSSGMFRLTVSDPLIALNLRQQAGRTNVLANP